MSESLNIEIRVNAKRRLVMILVALSLLAMVYFGMGWMHPFLLITMVALVLFLPFAIKDIFNKSPHLIVNEEGIYVRTLHIGTIRWIDIKRAFLYSFNRRVCVCLELFNEKEYFARQSAYRRLARLLLIPLGNTRIAIDTSFMNISPQELFQIILSQCEKHRAAGRDKIKGNG